MSYGFPQKVLYIFYLLYLCLRIWWFGGLLYYYFLLNCDHWMEVLVYHFGFDLYSPDDQLRLGTFSCVLTNGAPLAKCLLMFLGHVNKNGLRFSSLFAGILYIFWTQAIFRVYMLQISSSALSLTSLLSWRAAVQTHHFTPCSAAEILTSSKAGGKHVCAEFTAFYGHLQRVFQEQL